MIGARTYLDCLSLPSDVSHATFIFICIPHRTQYLQEQYTKKQAQRPVRGPPGTPGMRGRDGVDGRPGMDGPMGHPGRDGPQGKDGHPGSSGSPGPPGVNGLPGHRGEKGFKGQKGEHGQKGSFVYLFLLRSDHIVHN